MNRLLIAVAVLSVVGVWSMPANPQNSFRLTSLGDKLISSIQAAKSDWTYEASPLMEGSNEVIVQRWTCEDQSVRIALISHESSDSAARKFLDLARDNPAREVQSGLDDEGFSWGRGTVSFRKQRLTIDISAVITSSSLDLKDLAKNADKEKKLTKEFARLVAATINDQ